MGGLFILATLFLWIVALKTVAVNDDRWIPLPAAVVLTVFMGAGAFVGGAHPAAIGILTVQFSLFAWLVLRFLQRSDGILVYLGVAMIGTAVLFFGVPETTDWLVVDVFGLGED